MEDARKREVIESRRGGLEYDLYGRQLDLKIAEAVEDEGAGTAAQEAIDGIEKRLKVLDEAEAELPADEPDPPEGE